MQQNLLNAGFVSGEYLEAGNKKVNVVLVMKALTKELLKSFCCICACRQLHFSGSYVGTRKKGGKCAEHPAFPLFS
jgi:hypothetical protein